LHFANRETFYLNGAKDLRGFGVFNVELAEGNNAFSTIFVWGAKPRRSARPFLQKMVFSLNLDSYLGNS
jgi:hypothetical protein